MLAYRSSGRARGGYLGEAFMSTHAFVIDKLEDPMLGDILAYVQRDEFTLSQCYEKVSSTCGSKRKVLFITQLLEV